MNWQTAIDHQLDQIAAGGPGGPGSVTLSLDTPRGCLHCELAAVDTLACTLRQLWLETDALAQVTVEQLRQLAHDLTARLSYLLEPISSLELDPQGFSLQLRSSPPQRDEGSRRYYELTARRGGEVRLCRYAKHPGQPRELVPASVTREVLCRLARDFDAAVAACQVPGDAPPKL